MAVIDKREFKRGDIYWIDNEYEDENGKKISKPRPGIIISGDDVNRMTQDLEIIWLTTAKKKTMQTHVTINSARDESTAMCEKITTINKLDAGYYIGSCTEEEIKEIEKAVRYSLGLNPEFIEKSVPAQPSEETTELKIELAKARAEADLMKELYAKLLETKRKKQ